MSRINDAYNYQVEKSINDWGKNILIIYGSTANCSSCGYDPVNKESTNVSCSTCSGKFFYQTENTKCIKAVVKTFVGDLRNIDHALYKYGYLPEHDARITCMLSDVLINDASVTGRTYLDVGKNIRVEFDAKQYDVKNTYRTGVDYLSIMVASLKEK